MNTNDMLARTIRVRNRREPGVFGHLATAVGEQQATLRTISTVALTSQYTVRDLDVLVNDEAHLRRRCAAGLLGGDEITATATAELPLDTPLG
jgi:hypothetical protein